MSNRFHAKYHRNNHHTTPDALNPDAGHDPIASPTQPFKGDFVLQGGLSATNISGPGGVFYSPTIALSAFGGRVGLVTIGPTSLSAQGTALFSPRVGINTTNPLTSLHVVGGVLIDGNLRVLGDITYLDTYTEITSALKVINTGTGPAVTFVQTGNQPVLQVFDDRKTALFVDGRTSAPGFVGIGTSSPNKQLSIVGEISSTDVFTVGSNTSSLIVSFSGIQRRGTAANQDLYLLPQGEGALVASLGNARGPAAVDLQISKSSPTRVASAEFSVIGGGYDNSAENIAGVVSGGISNTNSAELAVIGGGDTNSINSLGVKSVIAGGGSHQIGGESSVISGGFTNQVNSDESTISGGTYNLIDSVRGTISGGGNNTISSTSENATIGGGYNNSIDEGESAVIVGGTGNEVSTSGIRSVILGSNAHTISPYQLAIGGNKTQVNVFQLWNTLSENTSAELVLTETYFDYRDRIYIPNNTLVFGKIFFTAFRVGSSDYITGERNVSCVQDGSSVKIIGNSQRIGVDQVNSDSPLDTYNPIYFTVGTNTLNVCAITSFLTGIYSIAATCILTEHPFSAAS